MLEAPASLVWNTSEEQESLPKASINVHHSHFKIAHTFKTYRVWMAETMAAPGIIKAGIFKQLVIFAAAGIGNRKTN